MSQRRGELSDGEKRYVVYSCLSHVGKCKNLHFSSSQDLSFVKCIQLDPGETAVVCGFGKGGAGEVTLVTTSIEWKGMFP